jgi:5-methylcytosine-specific restriction protein A
MRPLLFARVGWMKWYQGPQSGDEKPIGGGSYNEREIGHEAYNFRRLGRYRLGYFQPRVHSDHVSSVALERIQAGASEINELAGVLAVFVATDPERGGQRIVGWFRDATVYRHERTSNDERRDSFSYYLKTPATARNAVLVPEEKRWHAIPHGKGGFGQANVCYPLEADGQAKSGAVDGGRTRLYRRLRARKRRARPGERGRSRH